jgi:hypothetical protein
MAAAAVGVLSGKPCDIACHARPALRPAPAVTGLFAFRGENFARGGCGPQPRIKAGGAV